MPSTQIPCPECASVLKLPDRSLLGKTGRCPSCRHTFVLVEPEDEVQLELADASVDDPPQQGTSARWVPDKPAGMASPPDAAPRDEAESSATSSGTSQPVASEFPVFDDAPSPVGSRSKKRKRRTKKAPATAARRAKRPSRMSPAVIVGGVIVVLAVVGVAVTWFRPDPNSVATVVEPAESAPEVAAVPAVVSPAGVPSTEDAKLSTRPISLGMVPAGASVVINLRPRWFWTEESHGEELRFCLGPLGEWAGAQMQTLCRFPPEEIDEAMICLMLGQRGDPPEVAVVVRFKDAQKPSVLLEKFPGQRSDDYSYPVYLGETHCYLRAEDAKTVAIGPLNRAEEMAGTAPRHPQHLGFVNTDHKSS